MKSNGQKPAAPAPAAKWTTARRMQDRAMESFSVMAPFDRWAPKRTDSETADYVVVVHKSGDSCRAVCMDRVPQNVSGWEDFASSEWMSGGVEAALEWGVKRCKQWHKATVVVKD